MPLSHSLAQKAKRYFTLHSLHQHAECQANYVWAVTKDIRTGFACGVAGGSDHFHIFLYLITLVLLSVLHMLCTGAMLHKRTAVPPHMPATAADMLLPSAAPILYHNQGVLTTSCWLFLSLYLFSGLLLCSHVAQLS